MPVMRSPNFKPNETAERQFAKALKKVAQYSGHVVEVHTDGAELKNEREMIKILEAYSKKLGPWAARQSAKMIEAVAKKNKRAWKNRSKQIHEVLETTVAKSVVGARAAQLVSEQVELIKSLPLRAAERAQKLSLEAVYNGTRANEIAEELQRSTLVSESDAIRIARTEVARSNLAITMTRAQAAGSKQYIWRTAGDSAVRESHKEMNGKVIDWDHPPTLSDGTVTHAGGIYNCRCVPGNTIVDSIGVPKILFRRKYVGKIVRIKTKSGLILESTPNHPILTVKGWRSIDSLNLDDEVIIDSASLVQPQVDRGYSSIEEVFNLCSLFLVTERVAGSGVDFHGDGTDHDIDVIRIDEKLSNRFESNSFKFFKNFLFTPTKRKMSLKNLFMSLFGGHLTPFKFFTFRSDPSGDSCPKETFRNDASVNFKRFCKRVFRLPIKVPFGYFTSGEFLSIWSTIYKFIFHGVNSPASHLDAETIGICVQNSTNLNELHSFRMKPDCIVDKSVREFSGFVYNVHTSSNYYFADGIAIHNCYAEPFFPD